MLENGPLLAVGRILGPWSGSPLVAPPLLLGQVGACGGCSGLPGLASLADHRRPRHRQEPRAHVAAKERRVLAVEHEAPHPQAQHAGWAVGREQHLGCAAGRGKRAERGGDASPLHGHARRAFGNMRGPKEIRVLTDRKRVEMVLAEATRGYDLTVLADVQRGPSSRSLFGTTVDDFLRRAPCATMLVQSPRRREAEPLPFQPWCPKTILVPTVGTERCRHAVEMAAVVAASTKATLVVLHVERGAESESPDRMGKQFVEHHAAWASRFGARVETLLVAGGAPEEQILAVAREREVDLIVLGSGLRVASTRAFFGNRIERMLAEAPCAVAIVCAS
jgi:nucleotide-binding universal stress UspA family protein